ncbi:MAG: class I SAM-dependent methyltransferase [Caldiserica bacterium]|nr:class I SAM-dependent methyltransferase [Caldisericota bacterium]
MRQEFLSLLVCPYCKEGMEVYRIVRGTDENIQDGVLRCQCRKYPIVNGILFVIEPWRSLLLHADFYKKIFRGIASRDFCSWLFLKSTSKIHRMSRVRAALRGYRAQKRAQKELSFFSLSQHFGLGAMHNVRHRFSTQTFWNIYAALPLLTDTRGYVLDFASGLGHSAYVLSHFISPEKIVCVDSQPFYLYLAKKYLAPDAEMVCSNDIIPLPFKRESFEKVIAMDCLHCIEHKSIVVNSFQEIVSAQGIILLLHLHNALGSNYSAGMPLSPREYRAMFPSGAWQIKMLPEEDVLRNFLQKGVLDLEKEYREEEINSSNVVNMLISKSGKYCKKYAHLQENLLLPRTKWYINPIYRVKEEGENYLLELNFPTRKLRKENPLSLEYLPREGKIPRKLLHNLENMQEYPEEVKKLITRFVLLPLPERYI